MRIGTNKPSLPLMLAGLLDFVIDKNAAQLMGWRTERAALHVTFINVVISNLFGSLCHSAFIWSRSCQQELVNCRVQLVTCPNLGGKWPEAFQQLSTVTHQEQLNLHSPFVPHTSCKFLLSNKETRCKTHFEFSHPFTWDYLLESQQMTPTTRDTPNRTWCSERIPCCVLTPDMKTSPIHHRTWPTAATLAGSNGITSSSRR